MWNSQESKAMADLQGSMSDFDLPASADLISFAPTMTRLNEVDYWMIKAAGISQDSLAEIIHHGFTIVKGPPPQAQKKFLLTDHDLQLLEETGMDVQSIRKLNTLGYSVMYADATEALEFSETGSGEQEEEIPFAKMEAEDELTRLEGLGYDIDGVRGLLDKGYSLVRVAQAGTADIIGQYSVDPDHVKAMLEDKDVPYLQQLLEDGFRLIEENQNRYEQRNGYEPKPAKVAGIAELSPEPLNPELFSRLTQESEITVGKDSAKAKGPVINAELNFFNPDILKGQDFASPFIVSNPGFVKAGSPVKGINPLPVSPPRREPSERRTRGRGRSNYGSSAPAQGSGYGPVSENLSKHHLSVFGNNPSFCPIQKQRIKLTANLSTFRFS